MFRYFKMSFMCLLRLLFQANSVQFPQILCGHPSYSLSVNSNVFPQQEAAEFFPAVGCYIDSKHTNSHVPPE